MSPSKNSSNIRLSRSKHAKAKALESQGERLRQTAKISQSPILIPHSHPKKLQSPTCQATILKMLQIRGSPD
jgi:hypothetical protein